MRGPAESPWCQRLRHQSPFPQKGGPTDDHIALGHWQPSLGLDSWGRWGGQCQNWALLRECMLTAMLTSASERPGKGTWLEACMETILGNTVWNLSTFLLPPSLQLTLSRKSLTVAVRGPEVVTLRLPSPNRPGEGHSETLPRDHAASHPKGASAPHGVHLSYCLPLFSLFSLCFFFFNFFC